MELDHEQKVVAMHVEGPLLLFAGPGTGKTRTLSVRVATLVQMGKAAATDILAITFTRDAATVMAERIQKLLGHDLMAINAGTFHSVALRLLQLGGRKLKVADEQCAFEEFKRALLEVGLPPDKWDPRVLFDMVAALKERLISAADYQPTANSYGEKALKSAYERYQTLLAEKRLCDFGDLILGAVEKLYADPEFLTYVQTLFPFVMVDEFQDTSVSQYEMVRCLTNLNRNLLVVGSPSQSIHEWRGANVAEIQAAFRRDFPAARAVTLTRNYRCTANIVAAATAVGSGYPDALQVAARPEGPPIELWQPANQFDEAAQIAAYILSVLDTGEVQPEHVAVLFRTHRQADVLESQLSACAIPYVVSGAQSLYQQAEVGHILAYLHLATDRDYPGALQSIINIPPRGLGPNTVSRLTGIEPVLTWDMLGAALRGGAFSPRVTSAIGTLISTVDTLSQMATENVPPDKLIEHLLEMSGYRVWAEELLDGYSQLRALEQVVQDASQFDHLPEFLRYADGRAGLSFSGGVTLTTMHAAKGLEWPVVCIAGVIEGVIPHARALKTGSGPDEERRLLYVAMTRALNRLVISAPCSQVQDGRSRDASPSRYLRLLPMNLLNIRSGIGGKQE